ncbi:MAG: O-antigen ligase family protein [Bacilli bacterium]|nr:O-antigen ligase family protein [Bacilli bacterium]
MTKLKKILKNHSFTFWTLNLYLLLLIIVPKDLSTILNVIPIRLVLSGLFLTVFIIDLYLKNISLNKVSIKWLVIIFSIFLIFTIPSIFVSKNIIVSLYTLVKYLMIFLITIVVLKINLTKDEYKIIIKNILLATLLVSLYGVYEYYFSSNLFTIGSEKYLGSRGRTTSTFFNTIYFGIYINIVFCFILYLFLKTKNKLKSLITFIILSLLYLCLILTFTRSSLLIFFVCLAIFLILTYYMLKNIKIIFVISMIILISTSVSGSKSLFNDSFSDGFTIISNFDILKSFIPSTGSNNNGDEVDDETDFDDDSLNHRQEFAIIAKKIGNDNAPFGIGFGAYIDYMNSSDFDNTYPEFTLTKTHPHSTFTLMYAEVGIVSTLTLGLFYIGILFAYFKNIVRNFARKDSVYALSVVGFVNSIGFFAVNLLAENATYDTQIFPIFIILNALLLSYIRIDIEKQDKKILFISSTGGHLSEMLQLKSLFDKYDYFLVTEKTKSNLKLRETYKEKVDYIPFGSKLHPFIYIFKLIFNCFKSLFIYIKFGPDYIITTGAHTAGPMCCIGKIFGSKIIFIESFANINTKTVTGRIIYHFADLFIVQWEDMLKVYPKATYGGWIY